jgi:hypothetical protein
MHVPIEYTSFTIIVNHQFGLNQAQRASQVLTGCLTLPSSHVGSLLINTPLQRGGTAAKSHLNRFSGFSGLDSWRHISETAEAVDHLSWRDSTPLKRCVNERSKGVQILKCVGPSPHPLFALETHRLQGPR